jgi:hypothetical protein
MFILQRGQPNTITAAKPKSGPKLTQIGRATKRSTCPVLVPFRAFSVGPLRVHHDGDEAPLRARRFISVRRPLPGLERP